MAQLGLTYVRMAEFSWSNIEPSPGGIYNWAWLDQVLDLAYTYGLRVVLGTYVNTINILSGK